MKTLATVALVGLAYGFEDNELRVDNPKPNTTFRPQNTGIVPPHLRKDTQYPNIKIDARTYPHWPTTGKRPVSFDGDDELFIDGDDEFFYRKLTNITSKPILRNMMKPRPPIRPQPKKESAIHSNSKNTTHLYKSGLIHHPRNSTFSHLNTTHIPHPHNNRTRPFHPTLHHNRTLPQKFVALEDEELWTAEDNELVLLQLAGKPASKLISFEEELFNLEKLLADASKTVGDVKQKPKNYGDLLNDAINIVKDIKQKDENEDNALFDLQKLLADASKTVGDVKQNPRNYGELLNDAINIAKDIKRKDDIEDSNLWKEPIGRTSDHIRKNETQHIWSKK